MPRMTNTYMLAATRPEEIVASLKNGLYATNFGGGQVDITNSGKFVFSASEAFWVGERQGSSTRSRAPPSSATARTALTRVSMIGNDLAPDTGIGVRGKDGQSVRRAFPADAAHRPADGRGYGMNCGIAAYVCATSSLRTLFSHRPADGECFYKRRQRSGPSNRRAPSPALGFFDQYVLMSNKSATEVGGRQTERTSQTDETSAS